MEKYFCVGTIFKNESHIMKEWIEHYFLHGVDHIFMINDMSSDNYMEIIEPYLKENKITLYHSHEPYYLGRQRNLYNRFFLPVLKSTYWFGIFDMDEFLFSVLDVNLKNILKVCENIGQIQINHTLFGSNNLISHPKYIVPNFTMREDQTKDHTELLKYIINSNYEFSSLNIHFAEFVNKEFMTNGKFVRLDYSSNHIAPIFTLNHYYSQSMEFWQGTKCTRGDADNYLIRDMDLFHSHDKNEIEDKRLFNQNKSLYSDS